MCFDIKKLLEIYEMNPPKKESCTDICWSHPENNHPLSKVLIVGVKRFSIQL